MLVEPLELGHVMNVGFSRGLVLQDEARFIVR